MSRDYIAELELLVELLEIETGPIRRNETTGDVRVYRNLAALTTDAEMRMLYHLRGHQLVEWGDCHFYRNGHPMRTACQPLPILTDAGRWLALAELG